MTKSKKKEVNKTISNLSEQSLSEYVAGAMLDYGSETVEERAIPDFRDGLKPVHRMILFAMYKLGLDHKGKFKKAARTVGEVLGKFHAHGDISCYQAMVGLTGTKTSDNLKWRTKNTNVPLIEGFGNWGNFIDSAAAMRYTEARMSKLGDLLLLDPDGMAVMDTVKNFSEDEDVPVILPAKLPLILLNGTQGIAVGVSMSSPSFELKGVIELTKRALAGETITHKECAKTLKFVTAYGGHVVSKRKDLVPIFSGKGSAEWIPEYEFHPDKKMMMITSACPGLMSEAAIETLADKCTKIKGVSDFSNETGKFGVRYEISFQRGLDDYAQQEIVDKVIAQCLTKKEGYDLGITIRQTNGRAKFQRIDVPTILKMWAEWRISVELKIIHRLIKICEQKISRQKLYLKAIDCLDIIVKALKLKKKLDPEEYLVEHMKITAEEAHIILEMKVRQLRSMERDAVVSRIKELEKELNTLVKDTKRPGKRCLAQLEHDEPILLAELG